MCGAPRAEPTGWVGTAQLQECWAPCTTVERTERYDTGSLAYRSTLYTDTPAKSLIILFLKGIILIQSSRCPLPASPTRDALPRAHRSETLASPPRTEEARASTSKRTAASCSARRSQNRAPQAFRDAPRRRQQHPRHIAHHHWPHGDAVHVAQRLLEHARRVPNEEPEKTT